MEQREKTKKGRGPCAYCGMRPWSTREHVVPRALFPKPMPSNAITVGTCVECNGVKSTLDDYLRDCLVGDVAAGSNQAVKRLRTGEMKRSVESNRSILSRQAVAEGKMKPMFTVSGVYAGQCVEMPVDTHMLGGSLQFIVRGLYYHLTRNRIPDDYVYEFIRINKLYAKSDWEGFGGKFHAGMIAIGRHVFKAKYIVWGEDHFTTAWCLCFYDSIVYRAYVASSEIARNHLIPSTAALQTPKSSQDYIIINPIREAGHIDP
jgi:hypothetical protein